MRFCGWRQTYDLTVEGANHYISETGMVNAQTHIGFDELVTFLEEQYDNIRERLRSTDPVLKHMLKVRSMSNPVVDRMAGDNYAIDPYWVRKRFVDFNPGGNEVQVLQETMPNGKTVEKTLLFLPARLSDNPDPEFVEQYTKKLMFAKPHIRAAQLYGNWYVTAGSFFGDEWNDKLHIVKPFHIPPSWKRFRAMDWGYKKPGVVLWLAMDDEDNLIVERELTFKGMTVREVAKRIQQIETDLGLWHGKRSLISGPADTQLWEKRGEEGLSKAEEFLACGISWVFADKKSRQRNAERIAERLKDHDGGTKVPGIVFFENCKMCIRTIPSIQSDPKDPSVPIDGGDDHHVDTVGYACAFASRGKLGIPSVLRKSKVDEDDDTEREVERRGKWGYGGA